MLSTECSPSLRMLFASEWIPRKTTGGRRWLRTSNRLSGQLTAKLVRFQPVLGNEPRLLEVWSILQAESNLSKQTGPILACSVCDETCQVGFWGNPQVHQVPWEPPGGCSGTLT